jgi:hypothetical protein
LAIGVAFPPEDSVLSIDPSFAAVNLIPVTNNPSDAVEELPVPELLGVERTL